MSRFDYDDDGEWSEAKANLWEANLKRALSGKRGQKALVEFREALLAMPGHRLVRDVLVTEAGDACAIGAYAIHKKVKTGITREEAANQLMQKYGDEPDGWSTSVCGQDFGLTHVLAWHLGWENDEGYYTARTPEELWQQTFDWVNRMINEEVTA